jgi:rhodanese-related sulfurtransferase
MLTQLKRISLWKASNADTWVQANLTGNAPRNPGKCSMPQSITLSSAELVAAARSQITELSPQEAIPLVGNPEVVLVDIRDVRELDRDGRVPGSFHCPRGMLEFWIDPASPYHKPIFAEDKRFVFFCGGGMRSVLATKVAQDMGLKPVAHIIDGFAGWKSAGGPIEKTERKPA